MNKYFSVNSRMKKTIKLIALFYSILTFTFFNKIVATTSNLVIYAIVTTALMSIVLYINYVKKES